MYTHESRHTTTYIGIRIIVFLDFIGATYFSDLTMDMSIKSLLSDNHQNLIFRRGVKFQTRIPIRYYAFLIICKSQNINRQVLIF